MIPLSEVRVLDANAEALGVPTWRLVQNAGRAVADAAETLAPKGDVVVLAGKGNNGADGREAARLLVERGRRVALLSPHEHTALAAEDACGRAALIVDALLGAGLSGAPRAPYDAWVAVLRHHAAKALAVDVPTGFGTPLSYAPRATITLHDVKEGMSEATCGAISVADVGIPREASTHTGPGEYLLYPQGKRDQHKG